MKLLVSVLLVMILSSCVAPPQVSVPNSKSSLPDLGAAPELESDTWINTDAPLSLSDLARKSCIIGYVDLWLN